MDSVKLVGRGPSDMGGTEPARNAYFNEKKSAIMPLLKISMIAFDDCFYTARALFSVPLEG